MIDAAAALAPTTEQVERAKYERAWSVPEYRHACHSLQLWEGRRDLFPKIFASAVDLGAGSGRLFAAWNDAGVDAWAFDIADNCLDPGVAARWGQKLRVGCLWTMEWGRRFNLGICTDVMEHIPPERVAETLRRIAACCDEVLFKIAHSPNQLGGEVLHLTLQPWPWWIQQMNAVGGTAEYLGVQMRSGNEDSLIRWRPR